MRAIEKLALTVVLIYERHAGQPTQENDIENIIELIKF